MKVHEQVQYLQMTRTSIAVGTPARIAKLITEGNFGSTIVCSVVTDVADALKLTKETMILLDIGHRDTSELLAGPSASWTKSDDLETRTLLTMPEARTELWKSVFSGEVRKRIMDVGAHVGAV
jgi:protein CMS1